ncbi:unnamed protein product [Knipowitschia caucasica]
MALRVLLLSLCCLGAYRLRLEGGASRCQGEVQLQRPGLDWTPLGPDYYDYVPLEFGSRVCSELDCGSALSLSVERKPTPERKAVKVKGDCDEPELIDCFDKETSDSDQSLHLNCSGQTHSPFHTNIYHFTIIRRRRSFDTESEGGMGLTVSQKEAQVW